MAAFLPQCFLMGKLRKGLEGRSFCPLFLPCFCHQEKALQQFYSELWWRAIMLAVQRSTMHAKVEESHIKIVTNFTAVFAIISMKCRTTVYALNLLNKHDCIT